MGYGSAWILVQMYDGKLLYKRTHTHTYTQTNIRSMLQILTKTHAAVGY